MCSRFLPHSLFTSLPDVVCASSPLQSCTAYKDRIAQIDDPVVEMLEASGGIVIGKSVMPELYCATDDNSSHRQQVRGARLSASMQGWG